MLKKCNTCGQSKELTSFSRGAAYRDGYRTTCHPCVYARKRKKERESIVAGLTVKVRNRLGQALRRNSLKKGGRKTFEILGCTREDYRAYLESLFQPGMTWENYGVHGWHIDHIVPISSFDISKPEELKKAFHYLNTRPMWAAENWKKGTKNET